MREARVKLKDILTLLRRLRQTLEKEKKRKQFVSGIFIKSLPTL